MEFYRGFVEVKNKIPVSKYSDVPDEQLMTIDQAKQCSEYSGVLAPDTVCLDWDRKEDADIALKIIQTEGLKCRVIKTTKGIHALFKNDGTWKNTFTARQMCCGLVADCKLGVKNGLEYLKDKNGERAVLYDTKDYETVPFFFRQAKRKDEVDFIHMGDGDGRNSAFYNWIITLSKSMTKEEAKTTLALINAYVVKEPLPDSELSTICRDDAFPANNGGSEFINENGSFEFSRFARSLIEKRKIIRINNNLHVYKDGVYVQGKEEIERIMIEELPTLTQARRNEVFSYLNLIVDNVDDLHPYCMYIAFKNGIYNILTDKLEDFNPDYIITNKINYDYKPDAYCEVADRTLNKMACNDPEIRSLMEEMIGSCFYRSNKLGGGKAFILTGNKSNGKSTFLDMIKHLMGKGNYCALDLNELGDRFNKAIPFGKLVNIGDDIGDKFIDDSSVFKKMVTGEDIAAERKGQDGFNYTAMCKLTFASNNLPKVRDKTGAIKRRLIIIPFNAEFKPTDSDFNPMIGFRLMQNDVMEYVVRIGIEGLKRVLNNNGYTDSKKTKIALDAYDKDNNPIMYFFEDLDFDLDIDCQPTNEVYNKYREFCLENNLQSMSNIEFTKAINREYDTTVVRKRVDGKLRRIFTK